jgi:hypothetical protein
VRGRERAGEGGREGERGKKRERKVYYLVGSKEREIILFKFLPQNKLQIDIQIKNLASS